MKLRSLLFTFILALSVSAFATEADCPPTGDAIVPDETISMMTSIGDELKKDFKRRKVTLSGYQLALSIETNFTVPLVGNDPYFGRIYFTQDQSIIKYRDELITDDHYKDEKKKNGDSFFMSSFNVADINKSTGLSLVKAAGADVNISCPAKNFSPAKGGKLHLKVKAPSGKPFSIDLEVVVSNGKVQNYLLKDGRRIAFDSMKINAKKNVFGSRSILAGIENIQFKSGSSVSHSLSQ